MVTSWNGFSRSGWPARDDVRAGSHTSAMSHAVEGNMKW
jgi:hypothetical protein